MGKIIKFSSYTRAGYLVIYHFLVYPTLKIYLPFSLAYCSSWFDRKVVKIVRISYTPLIQCYRDISSFPNKHGYIGGLFIHTCKWMIKNYIHASNAIFLSDFRINSDYYHTCTQRLWLKLISMQIRKYRQYLL